MLDYINARNITIDQSGCNIACFYDHYLKEHSHKNHELKKDIHSLITRYWLTRGKIYQSCGISGVELGVVPGYLIPELEAYNRHKFYRNGSSENFSGKIINLPVHERIDEKTVQLIARCLRD